MPDMPDMSDPIYKECPKCDVMTEKITGCNKISCPNCKCKWCFFCGLEYPKSNTKRKAKEMNFCEDPESHKHKSDEKLSKEKTNHKKEESTAEGTTEQANQHIRQCHNTLKN